MQKSKKIQYIAAFILYVVAVIYIFTHVTDNPRYDLILSQKKVLVEAIFTTLWVSIVALILSVIVGFVFYLLLNSRIPFIRALAVIYREIIMGTPMLILIFLIVYVLGPLIGATNKLLLGLVSLVIYNCPYIANSFDGTIKMIDRDQYVVMDLYHFTGYQKYRYVIIPQIIRPFVPALINHLSSTIKGSALLRVVSVTEITYVITVISAKNWAAIEGYLVMWVCYLIITIPLSLFAGYIGKRIAE